MYNADPQPSDEQRQFIFDIMDGINCTSQMIDGYAVPDVQKCFFVSGEGGCGKTFLFNVHFLLFLLLFVFYRD